MITEVMPGCQVDLPRRVSIAAKGADLAVLKKAVRFLWARDWMITWEPWAERLRLWRPIGCKLYLDRQR